MASDLPENFNCTTGQLEPVLIAVLLNDPPISFKVDNSSPFIIGTILLQNQNILLEELRKELVKQIPALPPDFCFVAKDSWQVGEMNENKIKASSIINDNILKICRKFDFPLIGIKWEATPIGCVFVDLSFTLQRIRETIQNELNKNLPDSFIFFNQHKRWPITKGQEKILIGWDILYENFFVLCSPQQHNSGHSPKDVENMKRKKQKMSSGKEKSEMTVEERRKSLPTFNFNKDNKILISYVRAEATQHAKDLKIELSDLGFSVFLDIDEIQGGLDWQDALNNAVRKCDIFLPLITPQYGLTRWTNREVKLADVMEKFIIPINFLDYWPPDCLNIQFCSLQYIPWKTHGDFEKAKHLGEEARSKDIRFWDRPLINTVAKLVEISCRRTFIPDSSFVSIIPRNPSLRSYPSPLSEQTSVINKPKDGPALIVISIHPKQQKLGNELKRELQTKNVEVWCSTDDIDQSEDSSSSISNSPMTPSTPIIPLIGQSHSPAYNNNTQVENNAESIRRPSFNFSYSVENGAIDLFQMTNSQTSTLPASMKTKLMMFKKKADQAGVVIIVLSQAYCSSKMSNKQAYYCEHRKRTIVIKAEEFSVPVMIKNLLGFSVIEYSKNDFFVRTKEEVEKALRMPFENCSKCGSEEEKIQYLVKELTAKMKGHRCVYITGNTKFYNAKTENICHAIGQELAMLKYITLVTSGFYGVCEAVGRSFCEDREALGEKPGHVYHILPKCDSKDLSMKGRQNDDGTFQKVPYGQTIFIGSSIEERKSVVARVFNICILIEGGPRAACEVAEFVWNDHIVIPIVSTGGAASGKFGTSPRILEVPPGVNAEDWLILAKQDVTADDVGRAVKHIVCSLIRNRSLIKYKKKFNNMETKALPKPKIEDLPGPSKLSSEKTVLL